jgi:hypothetical protein
VPHLLLEEAAKASVSADHIVVVLSAAAVIPQPAQHSGTARRQAAGQVCLFANLADAL